MQVKCLGMTARWSGVSAPTVSTCTVSWNGWTHSRCSSSAPCADRSGSSKSDGEGSASPVPLQRPVRSHHRFKSVVNSRVFCISPSDVMLWTILLTDLIWVNENLKISTGLLLCMITCDTLLHRYGWIFSLHWSFFFFFGSLWPDFCVQPTDFDLNPLWWDQPGGFVFPDMGCS